MDQLINILINIIVEPTICRVHVEARKDLVIYTPYALYPYYIP